MEHRTHAYWSTRITLAVGIAAVLLTGMLLLSEPSSMSFPRMVENPVVLAAFLAMVVGLVWMIRIFRGLRDEPPPWRYRDRRHGAGPIGRTSGRTGAWYQTPALFALAVGAVLVPVVFLFFGPEALYADAGNSTLVVPLNGPLTLAGFLGMLVGVAWMVRIFRGPRDEPPPGRHRDC